jgi:3-oxoacyl-[acyl-carrier protein] reductase
VVVSLRQKNILVTGAGRGIGRAIALACGRAGARVAVHYNRSKAGAERTAKAIGRGSQAFDADLAEPRECEKLFREVTTTFGHIHALVNNAGVYIRSPLDGSAWIREWDRTMAINLRAAGILSRLTVRHFIAKGKGGRIITIASRAAFRGDEGEYLAYASSKAGLVALSKSIARVFGRYAITSFVIAPGWVRTAMAEETVKAYGCRRLLAEQALRSRLTGPEDIAPLVVFLASGLADHATGTTIDVNAGSYVH